MSGSSKTVWALVTALSVMSCGGGSATVETTTDTEVRPEDQPDEAAIARVGQRIYDAMVAGDPQQLLIDDAGMRRLVTAEAGERYAALRLGVGARIGDVSSLAFDGTTYLGVCLQGARLEPADAELGLRAPAWIFERALVAGRMASGRRTAAWVEGIFVRTENGFVALDLHSAEDPRWEHTDLEIAPCDMEYGIREPQDVGVVTR
jgi:hypothetical protein